MVGGIKFFRLKITTYTLNEFSGGDNKSPPTSFMGSVNIFECRRWGRGPHQRLLQRHKA